MDRDFLDFIIDVRNRPDGAQKLWEFLQKLEEAQAQGNDQIALDWLYEGGMGGNNMGISYKKVNISDIAKMRSIQQMGIPMSVGPASY